MTTILILNLFFSMLTAPPDHIIYIARSDYEMNQLTWSNIDFWMRKYEIRHPEIVMAQIKHETGNLTSRFCREQNNLCGMRLARCRATTAIGEYNRMAIYQHWRKSLEDYSIWQKRYYKDGDYYKFLSRHGYAEDIWYNWKLKRIKL